MNCSLSVSFEALITAKLVLFIGFISFLIFVYFVGVHVTFSPPFWVFLVNNGNMHVI